MPNTGPVVAVLDDEPEMRKALRRLLSSRGFRVQEYASGEDFLAGAGSQPPDYLLLDLHMPGINGFDILETCRSRHILVAIIVITAHDEPGTAERVRALGASAYLKKPVDRDALLSALATATSSAKT
jgi:CheY-like chemotaxis protein